MTFRNWKEVNEYYLSHANSWINTPCVNSEFIKEIQKAQAEIDAEIEESFIEMIFTLLINRLSNSEAMDLINRIRKMKVACVGIKTQFTPPPDPLDEIFNKHHMKHNSGTEWREAIKKELKAWKDDKWK